MSSDEGDVAEEQFFPCACLSVLFTYGDFFLEFEEARVPNSGIPVTPGLHLVDQDFQRSIP